MKRYQLKRFKRGNARSRAPSIKGIRKLPSVTGTAGTRKNHTITTPCMVKSRLYASADPSSPSGTIRFRRTSAAAMPPMKKNTVIDAKYKSAMRL